MFGRHVRWPVYVRASGGQEPRQRSSGPWAQAVVIVFGLRGPLVGGCTARRSRQACRPRCAGHVGLARHLGASLRSRPRPSCESGPAGCWRHRAAVIRSLSTGSLRPGVVVRWTRRCRTTTRQALAARRRRQARARTEAPVDRKIAVGPAWSPHPSASHQPGLVNSEPDASRVGARPLRNAHLYCTPGELGGGQAVRHRGRPRAACRLDW